MDDTIVFVTKSTAKLPPARGTSASATAAAASTAARAAVPLMPS